MNSFFANQTYDDNYPARGLAQRLRSSSLSSHSHTFRGISKQSAIVVRQSENSICSNETLALCSVQSEVSGYDPNFLNEEHNA